MSLSKVTCPNAALGGTRPPARKSAATRVYCLYIRVLEAKLAHNCCLAQRRTCREKTAKGAGFLPVSLLFWPIPRYTGETFEATISCLINPPQTGEPT